jgi:hypothetical protein
MTIEQSTYIEQNAIRIVFHAKIRDNDENGEEFGEISIGCRFDVQEGELEMMKGKESLPENITVLLYSITISTSRGYMASEFKGTYLRNAVLPIIDPKVFLKSR